MNKGEKVVLQIILFSLPFAIPMYTVGFDVATVVTVVSLIFAILVGFFIAGATSNYLRMQTLIATENANLMNIYNYVGLFAKDHATAVANAIDKYLTATLDFDLLDYDYKVNNELVELVSTIDKIETQDQNGSLYANLHNVKSQLFATNQEIAMTSRRIISGRHWTIIVALALLIVLLTLSLRDGVLIWNVAIGLLLIAIFQILQLMYEIDSNTFFANQLSYKSTEPIFAFIGKLPYYPESAEKEGKLKDRARPYRVGITKNTRRGINRTIKIVR